MKGEQGQVNPVQGVIESLYDAGRCPRLHINALVRGVDCPDFIRDQWRDRLVIDLDPGYPLDLVFDETGVAADLSFGGDVSRCVFPWTSIYVVADRTSGRGIVLDQHMPAAIKKAREESPTEPDESQEQPVQAALRTLDGDASVPEGVPDNSEDSHVRERRAAFRIIDGGD